MALFSRLLTFDEATLYRTVRNGLLRLYVHGAPTAWPRLLRNIALVSAGTLLPCLTIFLLRRPSALQGAMWTQVALHGFPVVFLVNLAMARVYTRHLDGLLSSSAPHNLFFLLGDAAARLALTILLTSLSFLLWTALTGAFAGSPASALKAVGGSFRFGIRFESLTGVYLYAVGLGAFPVFALGFLPTLATQRWCQALIAPAAYLLPMFHRPAIACALAFGVVSTIVLAITYTGLGLLPS